MIKNGKDTGVFAKINNNGVNAQSSSANQIDYNGFENIKIDNTQRLKIKLFKTEKEGNEESYSVNAGKNLIQSYFMEDQKWEWRIKSKVVI